MKLPNFISTLKFMAQGNGYRAAKTAAAAQMTLRANTKANKKIRQLNPIDDWAAFHIQDSKGQVLNAHPGLKDPVQARILREALRDPQAPRVRFADK